MTALLVNATVYWAIVLGLPLGIAAVVLLLVRFRAPITRSMRATAGQGTRRKSGEEGPEIGTPVRPVHARVEKELTLDIVFPEAVLRHIRTASGSDSVELTKRQPRRVALVYFAAASTFAFVVTVCFLSVFVSASRLTTWQLLVLLAADFAALVTPAVLAATYVLRKQVRYLILSVIALLAVVRLWDLAILKGTLFDVWLLLSAAPTGVALLLATRRLRAVGPAFIVGTVVWSGVATVLSFVGVLYSLHFAGIQFNRPDLQQMSLPEAALKYARELPHDSIEEKLRTLGRVFSLSKSLPSDIQRESIRRSPM